MPAARQTVNAGTNDEWEVHNTAGRTDGIVLSGHGSWDRANGEFRGPTDVRPHTYCMHGATVLDVSGARVETGDQDLLPQHIPDGRTTVPDCTIHDSGNRKPHRTPAVGLPCQASARGRTAAQTAPNSPARTPATNVVNAVAGTVRTGPVVVSFLESRTGTIPCGAARLVATSTHAPPLLLYEDVNQRGVSVVT